jgi:PKD repeat protein
MRIQRSIRYPIVLFLGLVSVFMSPAVVGGDEDPPEHLMTFSVTIQNLATGQPLSPPIVATHKSDFKMFRVGRDASTELELIARDGNQMPMYDLLTDSRHVYDVVDVGVPLTPGGSSVGGFTDSVTFLIQGREGDKMSLASMLICTNDGFVGLDRVKLPKKGASVFTVHPYDTGVEDNTEMSTDIVDACSALGPLVLNGDPNGNENGAVDTIPRRVITAHGGVLGIGDLGAAHQIPAGAMKVTVTRVSRNGMEFSTPLKGVGEVPIVLTDASGEARFKLDKEDDDDGDDDGDDDEDMDFGDDWFADTKDARVRHSSGRGGRHDRDELEYKLKVKRIVGVSGAHIHLGLPDMNGPVVADLFGPKVYSDPVEGDLSKGALTVADLDGGPFEGDWAGFLEAMGLGELYVNVHTAEFPSGEIRGQIGVRKAKEHDEFNRPPTGEITLPEGDVSIAPGESVFFEGTADDPDGDEVEVLWDFGDGESSSDLSPGDHTYEDPGTYTVTFTATDDKGLSDPTPDTRMVTVGEGANQPPVGIIMSPVGDVTIAAGESVFFEGTADDPDGDEVEVLWDFGDGESSSDLSPGDHTYEDSGTYTVTLTATDEHGLSDPNPDTRTATVGAGANQPPVGIITSPAGDVAIMPGESVFFEGMADDPDGDEAEVLWDFGDGESSGDLSPGNYTYEDPGTYTVTFTATDEHGLSDPTPDTRTITVEAVNQAPEGVITSPTANVTIDVGGSVPFAGMASDPDGDPVTVLWDFGDGMTSTQMSPGNHTYDNPGTYNVTFTATDEQGLSDPTPDTRTITVDAVPPAVTLTTLQATIFTPTCVRCHGGSEPEAGLDLSDGQSYGDLVNVQASTEPGVRVIPFDPDDSVLVTFLDDGHRNRPASERLQIRSWIAAGAQDD